MTRILVPAGIVPLLAACTGAPSMLAPRGANADDIAAVWWVMFWGSALVLGLVMVLLLMALYRRRGAASGPSANAFIVGGGLLLPVAALSALLTWGLQLGEVTGVGKPLLVDVIGHRWWWEVRYPGAAPVTTANEIHIPVGREVQLRLRTADVIHSLWVPQLAGKQDMIPGHVNTLALRADAPGTYRGQCAEFCGAQHAHMALWVVATAAPDFEAWLAARRTPAEPPTGAIAQRGRAAFLAERCVECHTVRGTPARGRQGPDLTHVGSRLFLGAGTLPNSPGAIARWITEHHRLKPGNLMDRFDHLDPAVVHAMAAWLEQLR
jgi:cytochrome c oxidase subunit 2